LIIGFGLRDTVANFAAGLLLLVYRPFKAGDLIEVENTQGVVDEMTMVNIKMTTSDGVPVFLPNAKVWGTKIVNFSWSEKRRIELTFRINLKDLRAAQQAVTGALLADKRVLKSPAPALYATAVEAAIATVLAHAWTSSMDYQGTKEDVYGIVREALEKSHIRFM
jgi:small conductance mechanosensitive channel